MSQNIPNSGLSARVCLKNHATRLPARTLISISIAGVLSTWTAHTHAQESFAPDAVVSAARTTQAVTDALPSTTVITRADIESATVSDVVSLLRQQVGVNIRQSGTHGAMTGISIRGGDAQHTLVLVDGVPLNNLSSGSASLEQIPLALVERIEIVRGNVSALYGSQATGGLVQIFTRKSISGNTADLTVGVGSEGQRKVSAQLSMGNDKMQWTTGVAHEQVNAISAQTGVLVNPDVDGYRNNSGNIGVRITPNDTTEFGARFFQTKGRNDDDSVYGPVDGVEYNKNRTQNMTLYANHQWNEQFSSALNLSQISDRYDYTSIAYGVSDTSRYETKNQQISLQNQWNSRLGIWNFGASHLHQTLDSTVGFLAKSRNTDSAWMGYQYEQNRHHLQLNGRFDRLSDLNSKNFLTGAINYGYDITPAWRVLAGYSNGFAAPSFNQLYYPPYCYGGYCFDSSNPNLKTEKANYAQLGVQWAQAHYGARVTYFDTRYRNKIANDANYIPQNIARARAKGVEAHAWYGLNGWNVDAGVTYQEVRDRDTHALLIRQPRWTSNLSLGKTWRRWQGKIDWQTRSNMGDSPSYGGHAAGYGVLNAAVHYQLNKDMKFGLTVGNVFNRQYEPLAGYNAMPRNFLFSVNYKPSW